VAGNGVDGVRIGKKGLPHGMGGTQGILGGGESGAFLNAGDTALFVYIVRRLRRQSDPKFTA
jgi:hypothetical protein